MSEDAYCPVAWDRAQAAIADPEYVATALEAGVRPDTAKQLSMMFHMLLVGRHDAADAHAREAVDLLAREYLEA